jgi:hypothetical protein
MKFFKLIFITLVVFITATSTYSFAQETDILDFMPAILAGALNTDNDRDGYSENQNDCNDTDASIYPGALEICGDGIDQDCQDADLECVPPPDTSAAAGFWHGTSTDQNNNTFSFGGIISTDGQLRFLIDEGDCFGTQFKGTFSMDGDTGSGTFTGYAGGICEFSNGKTLISGTIDFTIAGIEITGIFSSQEYSGTFSLTYDPQADNPITLAYLAGTWIGEEGDFSEIIISADGSFTGTDDVYGCNLTGQISIIDPDWSITDVSVILSDCDEASKNGVYTGLGLWQEFDEGRETFAVVVSSSTSSVFSFFAQIP